MIHASECQILLNQLLSSVCVSPFDRHKKDYNDDNNGDDGALKNQESDKNSKDHDHQQIVVKETLRLEEVAREIRIIIEKVPLSTHLIGKMLARHFPHKERPLEHQKRYTFVLLDLVKWFPHLQSVIFDLIIERCLIVDHDIQWEIECDTDNDDDDDESIADSDSHISVIHSDNFEKSMKCDEFIYSTLNFVESVMDLNDPTTLEPIFSYLLQSFEKSLLHTHKSKYTQFILFVAASFHPSFPDVWLGLLFQYMLNQNAPQALRLTAISYIASYSARASYLDSNTIQTCLSLLHSFAITFVQETPAAKSLSYLKTMISSKSKSFTVFYNVIQAILYIFCFRYKQLLSDSDSRITTGTFPTCLSDLKHILTSSFHPLLFVSRSIANEFARICHQVEIMYAFPLFETIKFGWEQGQLCDVYFPFDPIPEDWKSFQFVQELYLNWQEEEEDNTEEQVEGDELMEFADEEDDMIKSERTIKQGNGYFTKNQCVSFALDQNPSGHPQDFIEGELEEDMSSELVAF